MDFKIEFKLTRTGDDIKSTATGYLTEDNFADMVVEIKRWLDVDAEVEILGIEEA